MKNWINRFAMLAVLGSLVCGILVAGCGGSGDDSAPANTPTKEKTDDTQ